MMFSLFVQNWVGEMQTPRQGVSTVGVRVN